MVLPLDMPDDYPWLPGSGKSQLGDLAELAARLGSLVSYDRRGVVYFMDDFESGDGSWVTALDGTGAAARLTHRHAFSGVRCYRLTGGSSLTRSASVTKRIAPPLLTSLGLEATFSFEQDTNFLLLQLIHRNGALRRWAYLSINLSDQTLSYADETNAFVEFASVAISGADPDLYYTAKIVADYSKNEYLRVQFNENEYDLSGIPFSQVVDTGDARLEASLYLRSTVGNNAIAYLDNVIVTVGDP